MVQNSFTSSQILPHHTQYLLEMGKMEGTMLHIWWDCEPLRLFWREVHGLVAHVTTYTLVYTPAQFLLHHTTLSRRDYYKSLAMHMVNVA